MKNLLLVGVLAIAVLGCDISKFVNSGKNDNVNKPTPNAEPKWSPAGTPKPEPSAKPSVTSLLKKSAGKYPNDIKLLENAEIKDRLKKLLGRDFADMKAHWNVETPMEIEDGIFMASACEAHNCASNRYVMFVDLKSDNMNVFHIEDESGTKHYYEAGEITLPRKFDDELNQR